MLDPETASGWRFPGIFSMLSAERDIMIFSRCLCWLHSTRFRPLLNVKPFIVLSQNNMLYLV
jgi:hypothetical protein